MSLPDIVNTRYGARYMFVLMEQSCLTVEPHNSVREHVSTGDAVNHGTRLYSNKVSGTRCDAQMSP